MSQWTLSGQILHCSKTDEHGRPTGRTEVGKFSELFKEFAEPLFDVARKCFGDAIPREVSQDCTMLGTVAWNIDGSVAQHQDMREYFEAFRNQADHTLVAAFDQLVHLRRTQYRHLKIHMSANIIERDGELRIQVMADLSREELERSMNTPPSRSAKIGVNARCPCGSGKKYKQCCRIALDRKY